MPVGALVASQGSARQRVRAVLDPELPPTRVPSSITISPSPFSVTEAGTVQLTAEVRDQLGDVMVGEAVTWSSSASGTASVNASTGLVTGVASGTCSITATATNGTNLSTGASCTVSPAAVGSVTVSPTSLSMTEGATAVLTATVWTGANGTGSVLTGRTVTWASSNSGLASVTSPGQTATVTAVAAGSPTITATCETVPSTAVGVTVSAPASSEYPNEPAGFTVIHTSDFTGFTPSNPAEGGPAVQGLYRYAPGHTGRAITSDLAPYVGETVLDVVFGLTQEQGKAPEHIAQLPTFYTSATYTELYCAFDWAVPSDWKQPNSSTVQKLFHIWGLIDVAATGDGGSCVVPALTGTADSTTAQVQLGIRYQSMSTVNGQAQSFNGAKVNVNRGQWYKVEVYCKYNTGSAADGICTMFVDGVQRTHLTNLTYKNGGNKEWTVVQLNPTYGGTPGTFVSPVQHLYYRKWRTSGKA